MKVVGLQGHRRWTILAMWLSMAFSASSVLAGSIFDNGGTPPKPAHSPTSQPTTMTTTLRPTPSGAEVAKSRAILQTVFARQLTDTSREGRRELARAFLNEVPKTTDNPVDQYVLLIAASTAAKEGMSLPLCFEAIDGLAKSYEVDVARSKVEASLAFPLNGDISMTVANRSLAISLVDELAEKDDFATALKLCESIKSQFPAGSKQAAQLAKRTNEMQDAENLLAKLRVSPNDSAVNLSVGTFYCLVRNHWEKGLPLLAKGSNPAIAKAATDELAGTKLPGRAGIVGGKWWEAAETLDEPTRDKIRLHAAGLYKVGLVSTTGLARKLMLDRIEQVSAQQKLEAAKISGDPLDKATRIVFVIDATGSMSSAFETLKIQTRIMLSQLRPPQRFDIIVLNDKNRPPLAPDVIVVTPENMRKSQDFLDLLIPRGGTDASPFLKSAYDLKPDLIYFMIDPTDFTTKDKQAILNLGRQHPGGKCPVEVIAFEENQESLDFCKSIANLSGGSYQRISASHNQ